MVKFKGSPVFQSDQFVHILSDSQLGHFKSTQRATELRFLDVLVLNFWEPFDVLPGDVLDQTVQLRECVGQRVCEVHLIVLTLEIVFKRHLVILLLLLSQLTHGLGKVPCLCKQGFSVSC